MRNQLRPLKFIGGLVDRLAAAVGALLLSQFPQFYGQYLQRLGGHLDEARSMLNQYTQAASFQGLSLEQYIDEHLQAGSAVFVSTGEIIESLALRYETLSRSYQALHEAGLYNRWLVFLKEADWQIAAATWQNFVPGMPTTLEGLLYGLSGLLLGWGAFTFLKNIPAFFTTSSRRRNARKRPANKKAKERQRR